MPIPNELEPHIKRLEEMTANKRARWRTGSGEREVLLTTATDSVRLIERSTVGSEDGSDVARDERLGLGTYVLFEFYDADGDVVDSFYLNQDDEDSSRVLQLLRAALRLARDVPAKVDRFLAETAA